MAAISHALRINAPKSAVYDAVSTETGVKAWFAPQVEGSVEGGDTATMRHADGVAFEWRLEPLEPESRMRWVCEAGPGASAGSEVTFILKTAEKGGTRVELEHAGWPENHEAYEVCNTLWGIYLGRLRDYLEIA